MGRWGRELGRFERIPGSVLFCFVVEGLGNLEIPRQCEHFEFEIESQVVLNDYIHFSPLTACLKAHP
jgi:hypothetical protein